MTLEQECQTFCENIRLLREKNKLSKKKMAHIMGIGTATLAKIESGCIPPRLNVTVLERLTTYFGIYPQELFLPNCNK